MEVDEDERDVLEDSEVDDEELLLSEVVELRKVKEENVVMARVALPLDDDELTDVLEDEVSEEVVSEVLEDVVVPVSHVVALHPQVS